MTDYSKVDSFLETNLDNSLNERLKVFFGRFVLLTMGIEPGLVIVLGKVFKEL